MVKFIATIKRFDTAKGEKTGWTYIEVTPDIADKLKPGNKRSFRVKGKLDQFSIEGVALMPMGGGVFIMPMNVNMRKGTGKRHGAMLKVQLEEDKKPFKINKDFLDCMRDEPAALKFFQTLSPGHQRYFSNWIDSAKTEPTKTKRLAQAVSALAKKFDFGQMIRSLSGKNQE